MAPHSMFSPISYRGKHRMWCHIGEIVEFACEIGENVAYRRFDLSLNGTFSQFKQKFSESIWQQPFFSILTILTPLYFVPTFSTHRPFFCNFSCLRDANWSNRLYATFSPISQANSTISPIWHHIRCFPLYRLLGSPAGQSCIRAKPGQNLKLN